MTKEESLEKAGVNFNALKFELEYTAKNILLAMQIWSDQESAKAVAKRDVEIKEWAMDNTTPCDMMPSNPRDANFRRGYDTAMYDLKYFLSTPSVPTEPSIPIREAIKLKASCDGCEFEDKSFYDKPCVICNGFDQSIQSKL